MQKILFHLVEFPLIFKNDKIKIQFRRIKIFDKKISKLELNYYLI